MHSTIDQGGTIAATRARIDEALGGLFDPRRPFALLDFPDHDNVGDSAIYVGELAWLAQHGGAPGYVAGTSNFDWPTLEKRIGDGPVLLHGGGNFGDIWPWYQPFREAVLWRYRGRPVVQMPQTLHFATQEAIDQAARVIERHGAFTLLVRDQPSFDFATRWFACDVRLCPDMAFALGPRARGAPSRPLLMLLREDREAADPDANRVLAAENGAAVADWPAESAAFLGQVDRQGRRNAWASILRRDWNGRLATMWRNRAETRLERGLDMLREAEFVITDRLHAHILCVLLGIPHCVVDNSYGKIGGFMAAWNTDATGVWKAASVGEAVALYQSMTR